MRKYLTSFSLTSLGLALLTTSALAQQEAADAEELPEAADMSVMELFNAGGAIMYVLLLFSICAVGLVIYNFIMIRRKAFLRPDLEEQLRATMKDLHLDEAKKICDDNPSVLTNIVYAGLERVDDQHLDPEAVKEAMEDASSEELAAPFVMINYLSVIASVSPMVGLLGTVYGMVLAFRAISAQGMGQPQVLADNISLALVTTMGGLIVAIPSMIFYFFFKNRYGKIASGVSKAVGDLHYEMIRGIRKHAEG